MAIRIGIGYDIHRLKKGKTLYLGGITVPFSQGLVGHSDGDCLIHAIIDALLGAKGDKDIGQIFPDTDPQFREIRSTKLLSEVAVRLKKSRWKIVNIDSVIIAEAPKLADHIPPMKKVLSDLLFIPREDLNIKAKTNEGIGAIGRGEAIAAWAQALLTSEE